MTLLTALLLSFAFNAKAAATAETKHLESLRVHFPYGLIGDDYGILSEMDLALNTCGVEKLTPYSGELNMAYPYWQCFPLPLAKMNCDGTARAFPSDVAMGYLSVEASNEAGIHSYLARDAMEMRECEDYLRRWKRLTQGERYVCLSGPWGAPTDVSRGRKDTHWILEKFKTRRGCDSRGGDCYFWEASEECRRSILATTGKISPRPRPSTD